MNLSTKVKQTHIAIPLVSSTCPYDTTPDLERINGFYANGVGQALSLTIQLLGVVMGGIDTVRLSVLGSWVHNLHFIKTIHLMPGATTWIQRPHC